MMHIIITPHKEIVHVLYAIRAVQEQKHTVFAKTSFPDKDLYSTVSYIVLGMIEVNSTHCCCQ